MIYSHDDPGIHLLIPSLILSDFGSGPTSALIDIFEHPMRVGHISTLGRLLDLHLEPNRLCQLDHLLQTELHRDFIGGVLEVPQQRT